jgi:hypothetical protein
LSLAFECQDESLDAIKDPRGCRDGLDAVGRRRRAVTSKENAETAAQLDLQAAIAAAISTMGPDGEPSLPSRRHLRLLLGASWPTAEISAARHVLPIWTVDHGATVPLELLELAERARDDGRLRALLGDRAEQFEVRLQETLLNAADSGRFAPTMAGFAAAAAAHALLGNLPGGNEASELETDPLDWDASFNAAVAWAGGATWEPVGNPIMRREFWTWFLTEAVPAAAEGRVIE